MTASTTAHKLLASPSQAYIPDFSNGIVPTSDLTDPKLALNHSAGVGSTPRHYNSHLRSDRSILQNTDLSLFSKNNLTSSSVQEVTKNATLRSSKLSTGDSLTGQSVSGSNLHVTDNLITNRVNQSLLLTNNSAALINGAITVGATDSNGTISNASVAGTLVTSGSTLNASGRIGYNESYGRDIHDFWKFTVNTDSKVNLSLSGLTGDAGLAIYNSAGALLTYSNAGGTSSESIGRWLGQGDYYALIYSYEGWGGSTNYSLKFQEGSQLTSLINDYTVQQAVSSSIADGSIDRSNMISILQSTKDGSVNAEEITDLRDILGDANAFGLADYVKNLTNKVVNGDPANSRSGFGNLFAGSSSDQMENLVGKWFLGTDRPTASGSYQYVQGSLFQNGISIDDVNQGGVGDCYFLATMGAMAFDKPNTIQNMFIDNADGTFTVRFMKNGVADYVTVDRYLPTSGGAAVYAGWGGGSNTSSSNELWVALAEKAYAQLNESGWIGQDNTNSYAGIDGGWMAPVMQQTTGFGTSSNAISSMTKQQLIDLTNSDKLLTAGFVYGGGFGVVDRHAYTITGYNATTGKFFLRNPWGHSHAEVTWEQLRSLQARIEYTTV